MPKVINYANRISNFDRRNLPPQKPRSNPPQQKSECQKNPDSLACLEEKLSNLRSSGSVTVRRSDQTPADPQLSFGSGGQYLNIIGGQTQALEQQILKKKLSWV